MKSAKRRRVDVNLDELDRVLDGARQAPLSEADCDKLKSALHALAAMLAPSRNTEKTSTVLEEPENRETSDGAQPDTNVSPQPGHGRNGAEAFGGARKVDIVSAGIKCPRYCRFCRWDRRWTRGRDTRMRRRGRWRTWARLGTAAITDRRAG
jgi:hypothetical protein